MIEVVIGLITLKVGELCEDNDTTKFSLVSTILSLRIRITTAIEVGPPGVKVISRLMTLV